MKRVFAIGIIGLVVFEAASVYFIMPLPGSQRMRSIDAAYAVYSSRWVVRAVCGLLVAAGIGAAWRGGGWWRRAVPASLLVVGLVAWLVNVRMTADHIFLPPTTLVMAPVVKNTVARDRLVVGIEINGDARAYPLQFIGYHHQVRDSVGGEPVLVSYCTVCRTGRVFTPVVNGQLETFRLVGMDHFNAMFEDKTTRSWWRQANGEAITGALKGQAMPEVPSLQVTLEQWLALHPRSLVMQGDSVFAGEYAKDYAFERGTSRGDLTGTDTTSWGDKSWVVGITVNARSKAYDWNQLKRLRVINDEVGGRPIVLVLARDTMSFFAYERPSPGVTFDVRDDSLIATSLRYGLAGKGPFGTLTRVRASQEFWHSWRTFQPGTGRY